tara:strand:+ start:76 stop:180 length:105 start_codon:yes stop_codon:yes gene_type:complete
MENPANNKETMLLIAIANIIINSGLNNLNHPRRL